MLHFVTQLFVLVKFSIVLKPKPSILNNVFTLYTHIAFLFMRSNLANVKIILLIRKYCKSTKSTLELDNSMCRPTAKLFLFQWLIHVHVSIIIALCQFYQFFMILFRPTDESLEKRLHHDNGMWNGMKTCSKVYIETINMHMK